jgi:transcriptional regulator with XRE-family HTH domain
MAILRLKELMTHKGISREELAEKVGVSKTTISNISTETNLPTIKLLLEIATALDVDVRELFMTTKGGIISHAEILTAKEYINKGLSLLSDMSE